MKANLRLTALIAVIASLSLSAAAQTSPPQITNLVALQRANTLFVDITYDLVDADNVGAYIRAEFSANRGADYNVPVLSVTGDAGFVRPGTGKRIVWDAWKDWPTNYTTNAQIRLTADGSVKESMKTNFVAPAN